MVYFPRIERLPPYVFQVVNDLKMKARRAGEDIVDLGMGNPDQPPPMEIIEKLRESALDPRNHRYSVSRGIYRLRVEIAQWYQRRTGVVLDPDEEVVVTMGSKEGLTHLMMAILGPGDLVIIPDPTYSIHTYSVVIADGLVLRIPLFPLESFLGRAEEAIRSAPYPPKAMILNFPHNPTTAVVEEVFFHEALQLVQRYGVIMIHDYAYADLTFDGYRAPSIMSVPGAKEVAVELFTLSKSYSMPGWRVGFVVGRRDVIRALSRLKSYLDYGMFQPIQIASIIALRGPDRWVEEVRERYRKRRDVLIQGLKRIGWDVPSPRATMFVWAPIPKPFRAVGSLEFAKLLLREAKVAVSPGIGFGPSGEGYVRMALVENEHRLRQAVQGIRRLLRGHAISL
jgi:alanine-synthesizing transaminase